MGPAFISVKIQRFDPAERNYFIARLGEKLQERAKDSDRERDEYVCNAQIPLGVNNITAHTDQIN